MSAFTSETIVVRTNNVLATDLDDETIIMSIEQGTYYGVKQTARRIWELVEKPRSVYDLIALLSQEYRVEPEVCGPETITFLQELIQEGIIVVV